MLTITEETFVKNLILKDKFENDIKVIKQEIADHEITKQTEIDEYNTLKTAEIQAIQTQIDNIK